MSNIIEFPAADERELRKATARAALALHDYLADGPKPATCCRSIADKTGGNREIYERACASLSLWSITVGASISPCRHMDETPDSVTMWVNEKRLFLTKPPSCTGAKASCSATILENFRNF